MVPVVMRYDHDIDNFGIDFHLLGIFKQQFALRAGVKQNGLFRARQET